MKKLLACTLLALGFAQCASAVTLTFDDIPGGSTVGNYGDMPSAGYGGFVFSSTLNWIDVSPGASWPFGAHSGHFALLNNYGGVGTIAKADGTDFTFDGLYAKAWNTAPSSGGAPSVTGTLSGYKDGHLVWSVDTGLDGSYQRFAGHAGAIDELQLGFGDYFLVDDLTLDAGVAVVPEPAGSVLMGVGLGAIVAAARCRRRHA